MSFKSVDELEFSDDEEEEAAVTAPASEVTRAKRSWEAYSSESDDDEELSTNEASLAKVSPSASTKDKSVTSTVVPSAVDLLKSTENAIPSKGPTFLHPPSSNRYTVPTKTAEVEAAPKSNTAKASVGSAATAGRDGVRAQSGSGGGSSSSSSSSSSNNNSAAAVVSSSAAKSVGRGGSSSLASNDAKKDPNAALNGKDRVKRQRLAGQSGIGSDFRSWKTDEEMRQRQMYD